MIVHNPALQNLSDVPRFFTDPLLFSTQPERADYRPVLTSLFAIDYSIGNGVHAFSFQAENFAWLIVEVLCVYLLLRMMPGVNHATAVFAAAICAIHPAVADVANYPLQRSYIIGATCLCMGMIAWLYWPRMLPAKLPMKFYEFPRNRTEEIKHEWHPRLTRAWDLMLRLPLPFYLIPVTFGMLAEPSTAAFPLLLLAWIVLFEDGRKLSRVLPSALFCGGLWLARTVWILKLTSIARLAPAPYLFTQPWVAVRFLLKFFIPVGMSPTLAVQPFETLMSPVALSGMLGVALLIVAALFTARRREWRLVSFGLWWFLAALLPQAVIPQYVAAADGRMLMPMIGLTISFAAACLQLFRAYGAQPKFGAFAEAGAWTLACLLIGFLAFSTYERNTIWRSDETLWRDIAERNPNDGNALLNYGRLLMAGDNQEYGMKLVVKGAGLMPNNASAEMMLAQAYADLNRDSEADTHFRKALALAPRMFRNFSIFADWLSRHQRHDEALATARKAIELNGADLVARHVVLDDLSRRFQWEQLKAYAQETLRKAPQDGVSTDMIHVAEVASDKIHGAETVAHDSPSVDHFLSLSVIYFQNQRYADSAKAAHSAIELNPELPHGYANIGVAYYAMGKLDDSIEALRTAVKLKPELPGVKNTLEYELNEKNSAPRQGRP